MAINTNVLDATITNEVAPQLKNLVDALKAGTATDTHVAAVSGAIAVGVRKAIVQALEDSRS